MKICEMSEIFMKIVGADPSGRMEMELMWRVLDKNNSKKYIFIMQEYDIIGCEY